MSGEDQMVSDTLRGDQEEPLYLCGRPNGVYTRGEETEGCWCTYGVWPRRCICTWEVDQMLSVEF